MRRAMEDIAEDLESKRQRANASLSKLASTNLPRSVLGVCFSPSLNPKPLIHRTLGSQAEDSHPLLKTSPSGSKPICIHNEAV